MRVQELFISDTHFGHPKVLEYCPETRGHFTSTFQMDEYLIKQWNSRVRPQDRVWHMGDVTITNSERTLAIFKRLNGKKHLILGNHDLRKTRSFWGKLGFCSVTAAARIRIRDKWVWLSHYPYRLNWWQQLTRPYDGRYNDMRIADDGSWLVHGHVHQHWAVRGRMINVGVDVTRNMAPITADELYRIMQQGPCNIKHHTLWRKQQ